MHTSFDKVTELSPHTRRRLWVHQHIYFQVGQQRLRVMCLLILQVRIYCTKKDLSSWRKGKESQLIPPFLYKWYLMVIKWLTREIFYVDLQLLRSVEGMIELEIHPCATPYGWVGQLELPHHEKPDKHHKKSKSVSLFCESPDGRIHATREVILPKSKPESDQGPQFEQFTATTGDRGTCQVVPWGCSQPTSDIGNSIDK